MDLDGLPEHFDIMKFINTFNNYLMKTKYEDIIDFNKYKSKKHMCKGNIDNEITYANIDLPIDNDENIGDVQNGDVDLNSLIPENITFDDSQNGIVELNSLISENITFDDSQNNENGIVKLNSLISENISFNDSQNIENEDANSLIPGNNENGDVELNSLIPENVLFNDSQNNENGINETKIENAEIENKNKYSRASKLTPIYYITKNDNSSNHEGESYHIILNYHSYFIEDIVYLMANFSVLHPEYKPYIDLSVYSFKHCLRCIYQYNTKRTKPLKPNDIHYIYKIYMPEYPNIDLMKDLDNETKTLLSFIQVNKHSHPKIVSKCIDFDYEYKYRNDYDHDMFFNDLTMSLIRHYSYERK